MVELGNNGKVARGNKKLHHCHAGDSSINIVQMVDLSTETFNFGPRTAPDSCKNSIPSKIS